MELGLYLLCYIEQYSRFLPIMLKLCSLNQPLSTSHKFDNVANAVIFWLVFTGTEYSSRILTDSFHLR